MKKYGKLIVNFIFGSFIIVWFGNYLYEKLSISQKIDSFINTLSNTSQEYVDSGVRLVMDGSSIVEHSAFFIIFSATTILIFTVYLIQEFRENHKMLKKNRMLICIIFLILQLYNLSSSVISMSLYKTIAIQTPQNMEIIRPYISQQDYLKLKSDFFQINTYKDYKDIDIKIKKIAKDKDLHTR